MQNIYGIIESNAEHVAWISDGSTHVESVRFELKGDGGSSWLCSYEGYIYYQTDDEHVPSNILLEAWGEEWGYIKGRLSAPVEQAFRAWQTIDAKEKQERENARLRDIEETRKRLGQPDWEPRGSSIEFIEQSPDWWAAKKALVAAIEGPWPPLIRKIATHVLNEYNRDENVVVFDGDESIVYGRYTGFLDHLIHDEGDTSIWYARVVRDDRHCNRDDDGAALTAYYDLRVDPDTGMIETITAKCPTRRNTYWIEEPLDPSLLTADGHPF